MYQSIVESKVIFLPKLRLHSSTFVPSRIAMIMLSNFQVYFIMSQEMHFSFLLKNDLIKML